jgi:hypothetical protein
MWWKLKNRVAQRQTFWKLLQFAQSIRFEVRKKLVLGTEKYISAQTDSRLLYDLARMTVSPLLTALGTATILLIIDLYLPELRWRWAPLPLWHLADRDSYATFLSTIGGIGGVLIGFYYAGLTAVSSASYVQVPGVLRTLLLRQPVGSFYIRVLAFTTFVSLCLLAFHAVGFSPVRLAIPFLVLLSGLTILSFVHLGQQAFYFFDPTKLAGSVFIDLERWVKRATAQSRFWDDPSFQNHANRQADTALKALSVLSTHSSSQKYIESEAITGLAVSTLGFLFRYEHACTMIPSDSKWYPSQYEHPDFYAAGDLKVGMAIRTGGSVQPITVSNPWWVQDAALPLVFASLKKSIEDNNSAAAFRLMNAIGTYIERLGETWQVEQAISIIETAAGIISNGTLSREHKGEESSLRQLGLVESLGLFPIGMLLGFVRSLEHVRLTRIQAMLGRVRWHKPESLYQVGFSRFALPTLEWFRTRLQFEVLAERTICTPQWCIEQGVVNDYLKAFHKSVDLLLGVSARLYAAWHTVHIHNNNPWAGATVLNRHGEYLSKLQIHFEKLAATEKEYESARVTPDILGWPSARIDEFKARITSYENEYEIRVAREAHSLVGVKRNSNVPDFAGEFLSRTAHSVLKAIRGDDFTTFSATFPWFFQASIKKAAELFPSPKVTDETERIQRFNMAAGPLLDLMELSGYALLVSELRQGSQLWSTTKALWDTYFRENETGRAHVQVMGAVLDSADIPLSMPAGELIRTGWRMQVGGLLREIPVENRLVPSSSIIVEEVVQHPSALVRVLARDRIPGFFRGLDIFSAMYFVAYRTGQSRGRVADLLDLVERESGKRRNRKRNEIDAPAQD